MLLSIVECSDYRQSSGWNNQSLSIHSNCEVYETIGPVKGPSVSIMRNLGARRARGRWIFFKDDDCEVDPKKLVQICKKLERSQTNIKILGGVYQPRVKNLIGEIYSFIQRNWVLSGIEQKRTRGIRHAHKILGGAFLIHKETFIELGGFSEEVGWGAEELELTQRARQLEINVAVSYRLKIIHRSEMNLRAFIKRAWFQNFNPGYFSYKRGATTTTGLSYFNSPLRYWPSLVLFFGVATVANSSGVISRKWGSWWKS